MTERIPIPDIDPAAFWAKVDSSAGLFGCWPWIGPRINGYGRLVRFRRNIRAHRVAYTISHGPIPEGLQVCHTCDNPPCCNPEHLFVGTDADNSRDARAKGRLFWQSPRGRVANVGSGNGRAVLTETDVPVVRALASEGLSSSAIAARFGVSKSAVKRCVRREAWAHVA